MELKTVLTFLGFFVAVAAVGTAVWGLIVLANRKDRRAQEVWREFASQSGLDYEPKKDREKLAWVHGRLHRRSFDMHEERVNLKGGTESTEVVTRMFLKVEGMPNGLAVYERPARLADSGAIESLLASVAEVMGKHMPPNLETGDAAFDEKWVTRGFDADVTRTWISQGDRKEVLAELATEEGFKTHEDGLRWEGS
ncbi:MAG TPA: hypothetical protein VMW48_05870, partial [Vicinamibacterales bacterium]|nr:hypothetical protein [Vicinamibacterales bacterium]